MRPTFLKTPLKLTIICSSDYATPPVFDGSVSLSTIPNGTSVNETHIALTFLCAGCVDADLSFAPDAESSVMGFAVSDSPPEDPADEGTELVYHSFGFGELLTLGVKGTTITSTRKALMVWSTAADDERRRVWGVNVGCEVGGVR